MSVGSAVHGPIGAFSWLVQAAWEQESCLTSLKVNGLYEGSGLALWLRTGIYSTGHSRDVNPGSVPFHEIIKFKTDCFGKEVTVKAAVQRAQCKKQRTKERILWPIEMVCGCENIADAKHDHFDGSLNLASCHFVLWSWYLAVFEALREGETWIVRMSLVFLLPQPLQCCLARVCSNRRFIL